jgi:hypothetical protein
MSKSSYYQQAKKLTSNKLTGYQSWIGSTKKYWMGVVKKIKAKSYTSKTRSVSKATLQNLGSSKHSKRSKGFRHIMKNVFKKNVKYNQLQINAIYTKLFKRKNIIKVSTADNQKQYFTLNNKSQGWFSNLLRRKLDSANEYESDAIASYDFENIKAVTLVDPNRYMFTKKNKAGSYFSYQNMSKIDLSRYQIYNNKQTPDNEHCLMYCLRLHDISNATINAIKLSYDCATSIEKKDLHKIADILGRNIILHHMVRGEARTRYIKYGNNDNDNTIRLGLFEGHYFVYETTCYSMFSILNYDKLTEAYGSNIGNIKRMYKKNVKRYGKNFKGITSLRLISELMKLGKFRNSIGSVGSSSSLDLANIADEQQLESLTVKETPANDSIHYMHIGACINNKKHELYGIAYTWEKFDTEFALYHSIYDHRHDIDSRQSLVNRFLDDIANRKYALVYTHKLKYDYMLLKKYINVIKIVKNNGNIYSIKVRYKKAIIEFRDSSKIINKKLNEFHKMFKLSEMSNMISREYYADNYNKKAKVKDYAKLLPINVQNKFINRVKQSDYYNSKHKNFNTIKWYGDNLKTNSLILRAGMRQFNEIIKKITKDSIDVHNHLTISSLVNHYLHLKGSYDNVYSLRGNIREYVGRAVMGGRVYCNPKYQKKVINKTISAVDGNSFYPSAINRLCQAGGLPTGKGVRFTADNKADWNKFKYAVMTVKITKINKTQEIPMIYHKIDNEIEYSNNVPNEPVTIDSITLNDYIKFHDIEYDILDGVYWNKGYNKKMKQIVTNMYNMRVKYNNNIAMKSIIKLMMNSIYGKSIQKMVKNREVIVNADKKGALSYLNSYYNNASCATKINERQYSVKKSCADHGYNYAHVGCSILSMSKRMLNEIFDIANDTKCSIYYTDTDSLHLNTEDVPKIKTEYMSRYNRELIGDGLGQFNSDFKLTGAVGPVVSKQSIFLGKKSYIDKLTGIDKNGNKINGAHVRMAGITSEGLDHAKLQFKNYMNLFEHLANGNMHEFILNPYDVDNNTTREICDYRAGSISTDTKYTRVMVF